MSQTMSDVETISDIDIRNTIDALRYSILTPETFSFINSIGDFVKKYSGVNYFKAQVDKNSEHVEDYIKEFYNKLKEKIAPEIIAKFDKKSLEYRVAVVLDILIDRFEDPSMEIFDGRSIPEKETFKKRFMGFSFDSYDEFDEFYEDFCEEESDDEEISYVSVNRVVPIEYLMDRVFAIYDKLFMEEFNRRWHVKLGEERAKRMVQFSPVGTVSLSMVPKKPLAYSLSPSSAVKATKTVFSTCNAGDDDTVFVKSGPRTLVKDDVDSSVIKSVFCSPLPQEPSVFGTSKITVATTSPLSPKKPAVFSLSPLKPESNDIGASVPDSYETGEAAVEGSCKESEPSKETFSGRIANLGGFRRSKAVLNLKGLVRQSGVGDDIPTRYLQQKGKQNRVFEELDM